MSASEGLFIFGFRELQIAVRVKVFKILPKAHTLKVLPKLGTVIKICVTNIVQKPAFLARQETYL